MIHTGIRSKRRDAFRIYFAEGAEEVADFPGLEGWTFTVGENDEGHATVAVTAPVGRAITPDSWRRIPIGTVLATVRTAQAASMATLLARGTVKPVKRPKGGSDQHRAAVAEVYRIALEQGVSPAFLIAEHWQLRDQKTGSVWIKECRDHGVLETFTKEKEKFGAPPKPPGGIVTNYHGKERPDGPTQEVLDRRTGRSRGKGSITEKSGEAS